MSNLFKKGFASLALASVMASSVFAGDAAYIDVKVNYLSGTGKAVLGHESWNAEAKNYKVGPRKDLVELYIRVLDKDGNLADTDSVSDVLIPISLTRNGKTKKVDNLRTDVTDGSSVGEINATHSISRAVIVNKNAARYTLDYTKQSSATLVDHLTIKAGHLVKNIDIQLESINASGLLVRATTKNSIDARFGGMGRYINDTFDRIRLLGESSLSPYDGTKASDGNLTGQSHDVPQITAGGTVPLRIFASTDANNASAGKFTMAPNLQDKQIVVVAVGDYNINGVATVYLGQTELTMKNGIAVGDMMIKYGLPERTSTDKDIVSGNVTFDISKKFGGLGVAFIAYAKDDASINNGNVTVSLSNGALKITSLLMDGNNSNTDAIKVRSGEATGFRGGKFDNTPTNNLASNLWTGNKTDVFIANSKGISSIYFDEFDESNKTISIAIVDKLGNPAILATSILKADAVDATFNVNGNPQTAGNGDKDFNISNQSGMKTEHVNGVTSAVLQIRDGDRNLALSSVVEAKYSGESVAGLTPFKFNVHTVDLVGNTPYDIMGSLKPFIEDVNVSNGGIKKIYAEKLGKDDYVNMKLTVKVIKTRTPLSKDSDDYNTTLLLRVLNSKGVDTGIYFGLDDGDGKATHIQSDKNKGGVLLDINNTFNTVYMSNDASDDNIIAQIIFADVNDSTIGEKNLYESIEGTTTTFILKANGIGDNNITYRTNIDAYVATTTTSEKAKDFVKSTSKPGKPGKTVIDFDFSGTVIDNFPGKAVATITFVSGRSGNTSEFNDTLKAGIVGQPFVSTTTVEATANSRVVKAIIPENKRLSVALYGVYNHGLPNKDGNETRYNIQSITINGFTDKNTTTVYTSRYGNKLTDAVDIDVRKDNNITIIAGDETSAAKVKISKLGDINTGDSSGKDAKNLISLPNGLVSSYGTAPITTKKLVPVLTNTYYSLFSSKTDLEIKDAYGNQVDMGQTSLEKNYALSVSDTECAEVNMAKGDDKTKPAYIYFKPCAAGKKIDLIIAVSGNEEVKNTITFTTIVKKAENTAFNLSLDVGDTDYNIVHNDIVIKIIGDGGTERTDTTITATSDNPDANVKVVAIDLQFGVAIGSETLRAVIDAKGSYVVVTSDKPGTITVKADAIIPSIESASGDDVPITGSLSFKIVNVNANAPTATATANANTITVTIKDDDLDTKATTVVINNMEGDESTNAKHTSNGIYTASGLKSGTYSVDIKATDLSGNQLNKIIVIVVGGGVLSVEEAATKELLAKKEYEVAGTFSYHKFGDDNAKNWVYIQKSDGKAYQLLGNEPTEDSAFGFKEVADIKATDKDIWYMVRMGEGQYDWALSNADGIAYKLKGAKEDDGTFDFSGRLNLNASYKDGNLTFTK
jgi:hypothetical protein